MSAPLKQSIDGQAGELASRVAFIVTQIRSERISHARLSPYVTGLLVDVSDLLDLMGIAH
jgi:hypothetical protein